MFAVQSVHFHRATELTCCKLNLYLIDVSSWTAQGWSDTLKVLAECQINVVYMGAHELIEPELALITWDSHPNLDQE